MNMVFNKNLILLFMDKNQDLADSYAFADQSISK